MKSLLLLVSILWSFAALADPQPCSAKSAAASSFYSEQYHPLLLMDNDSRTRWSSIYADNQWFSVDLGTPCDIKQIEIDWEDAYASSYSIQLSDDFKTWRTVLTDTSNTKKITILLFADRARHVRVNCLKRATIYGCSVFELRVTGTEQTSAPATTPTTVYTANSPTCLVTPGNIRYRVDFASKQVYFSMWCRQARGVGEWRRLWSIGTNSVPDAPAIDSLQMADQTALDQALTTRALTTAESALLAAWVTPLRPVAKVSTNGKATTRPIYFRKPDYTLGADTGQTVAIGTPCKISDALWKRDATGIAASTDYFAVAGGYAQCTLSGPVNQ